MTFVLSWKFTAPRLVFGLILTFGVSYLANRFAKEADPVEIDAPESTDQPMKVRCETLVRQHRSYDDSRGPGVFYSRASPWRTASVDVPAFGSLPLETHCWPSSSSP